VDDLAAFSGDAIATEPRVGLLGDIHGDVEHLFIAARTFAARGVRCVVQLGDFGVVWAGEDYPKSLDRISRRLAKLGMTLYVVDGNHEDFPLLYKFPVDPDNLRRLRHNIVHLPRGFRAELASGRVLAVLGGANSIDRDIREPGVSWWEEESITSDDLVALGHEPADILLGHQAPLHVPDLDREIEPPRTWWPSSIIRYADEGREMFHRGFLAVRPSLSVGGHYHCRVDQTVDYGEGHEAFRCRVVVLDQAGPKTIAQAVLDVATLDLTLFNRGDTGADDEQKGP
jgi:predicted phosphodiesterase